MAAQAKLYRTDEYLALVKNKGIDMFGEELVIDMPKSTQEKINKISELVLEDQPDDENKEEKKKGILSFF